MPSLAIPAAPPRALLQLVVGIFCLAFSPILVRLADVGPVAAAFYRLLLAQPILVLLLIPRIKNGESLACPWCARWWAWLSGVFLALNLVLWNQSLAMISIANASLVDSLAPLFITLFAWWAMGERPSRQLALGMLLAIVGTGLLILGEGGGLASIHDGQLLAGHFVALCGALLYAAYFLALKQALRRGAFPRVMLASCMAATVTLIPLMLFRGGSLLPHGWMAWSVLGAMALLVHCAGQGLVGKGFDRLPAATASLMLLAQPVVSALLAWGLFSEALGALQIAGAGTVLAGVYWGGKK
ncbi:DMT family transporter [Paludibacterium purpuratum]|uniref:Threonine/homoserine efflux transporter RhtA n=1 Tax=Paludibacterium purpuratum TaxID=1144873 RepID=A0A4R7B3A8_9NEIS|nr:DMT family transporter [Paludibacterium purpuratum]TDR76654.1 threonine/homoserine efflux transporter RhtA [Paludibacterium purpuratum]